MERFTLDADAFVTMRNDFDRMLINTVRSMMMKNSDTATVSLKLDIDLLRTTAVDDEAPDGVRDIIMPRFEHKVSSVMQMKAEEKGKADGVYELSWDDVRNEYGMRAISEGQTTFDQYTGG